MDFAFIKDNVCFNIVIFENIEKAQAFKKVMTQDGIIDDIVNLKSGYGIGDRYENGVWLKYKLESPIAMPTTEERITLLEDTINYMLGL